LPHSIARETALPLSRRTSVAWPHWVEAALVAAAIAALLPWFDRFAADDLGRDRRFADAAIVVRGLPDPVLPALCASYAGAAEPILRERLCHGIDATASAAIERMPAALAQAHVRLRNAFLAPLADVQTRLSTLRLQQREGLGDLLAIGNAIESAESELTPFLRRYRLEGAPDDGPQPIACAFNIVDGTLHAPDALVASTSNSIARANAILLLGAAFDGQASTGALAEFAVLPVATISKSGRCAGIGLTDALAQSAALVSDARHAPSATIKNEAMRGLFRSAGWQWAAWMIAGFVLLQLARRSIAPAMGVALSLALWAGAAWLGRVPWPLASELTLGRNDLWWFAQPAPFVWELLAAAAVAAALSP